MPTVSNDPALLRELLSRLSGVRFSETGTGPLYRSFEADLSPCIALAGSDDLVYIELKGINAPLDERQVRVKELVSSRFYGRRMILVDSDAQAIARAIGVDTDLLVGVNPEELSAAEATLAAALVRDHLRRNVNLETLILYKSRGAVTKHRFFGREHQLSALKRREEAYLVTSTRQSGKSSLLLEAKRRLDASTAQDPLYPSSVYMDLKQYSDFPAIISAMLLGLNIKESISYSKKWPQSRWPEFFRRLRTYTKNLPARRLTLYLDEYDRVIDLDAAAGDTITWNLRALHQDNSSERGFIHFVIAGSKRLAKLAKNQRSALQNFLNDEDCKLTNFDVGTVRQMIADPIEALGVTVEDPLRVAQEVLAKTAGRPSSVQFLCGAAVQRVLQGGGRTFTVEAINAVVESVDYVRYYKQQIMENTDSLEQFILCAGATLDRFSEREIHDQLRRYQVHVEQTAIFDSLNDLVYSGFVVESQRGGELRYELATPVVNRIFQDYSLRSYVDTLLQHELAVRLR